MRQLTLIICFISSTFILNAQEQDSSDLPLRALVDSTFKILAEESKILDLPAFREYYIMKVKFMNDSIKRCVLYVVTANSLVIYSDPWVDNQLDTLDIRNIRTISFRKTGRTGDVISTAAVAGFLVGGAAGYISRICWDCESDGTPNPHGIVTGLAWGGIGAAAGALVGSIIAMFNNGSFTIKGNLKKFKKLHPKITKFSVSHY